MDEELDFDFRHHLRDTLILSGVPAEIADLLKKSNDLRITRKDIDDLRRFNGSMINRLKWQLVSINKKAVRPKADGSFDGD